MSDKSVTRYRVAEGREVVLPRGLARAPTGDNARYLGGETFDIETDNPEAAVLERYIRGRVRAGDIVLVDTRELPTNTRGGDS